MTLKAEVRAIPVGNPYIHFQLGPCKTDQCGAEVILSPYGCKTVIRVQLVKMDRGFLTM